MAARTESVWPEVNTREAVESVEKVAIGASGAGRGVLQATTIAAIPRAPNAPVRPAFGVHERGRGQGLPRRRHEVSRSRRQALAVYLISLISIEPDFVSRNGFPFLTPTVP